MKKSINRKFLFLAEFLFALSFEQMSLASSAQFEQGLTEVKKMAGCYVVDYSFKETESLKPGYVVDRRVYDVNLGKTTRELVLPIEKSPSEIRLQHILFTTGADGKVQFVMKHQAEDWEYQAPFLYDFSHPGNWAVKPILPSNGVWTRKVTNLDDGLRYQCAAPWDFTGVQPQWQCSNFAPIPGRETRDMGRKDYNTLDRMTHIVNYGNSFLERQLNVKTIWEDGTRTPLAREFGKTWYVQQPMQACNEAIRWATPRIAFWKLLMEEWETVFAKRTSITENLLPNNAKRYEIIAEIEERFYELVENDEAASLAARLEIRKAIDLSLGRQDGLLWK